MFAHKTKRYMTRAIAEELHSEILILLWQLIDRQKEQELTLDYLQVFELSVSEGQQAITHRQEIPERRETWIIPLEEAEPIARTVWCIDNDDGQMMLFPQDY
ncbi:DUF960 family protein [Paenisporosarcina macmurdoensis]|uniref:DUF960 family protein n=1 Tax=Paenisporosarcina macmurdoensis TaxID=212659 RepID=A0ABW1LAL1_9BACL